MEKLIIRPIAKSDFAILEDILYEAIFQPENTPTLPREIIREPEIWVYIDCFGEKEDDYGFITFSDEKVVGAVWCRILNGEVKGFGNIDDKTPEFAIALFKEFRNKGYGTMLMHKMIGYLKEEGYRQTSLSVNKENYAVRMYQHLGFEIIQENEHDYLMLLDLKEK